RFLAHALAAERIDQQTHFDAGLRPLAHDRAEARGCLAVLPDIRLEVDRRLRIAHLVGNGVEVLAVLDQLDGIAFDQRAVRQADERRQQRVELLVGMHDEVRLSVAAQRPDDEQQECDDSDECGNEHDPTFLAGLSGGPLARRAEQLPCHLPRNSCQARFFRKFVPGTNFQITWRLSHSAVNAGFVSPSISIVTSSFISSWPGLRSATSASTAEALIRLPTRTGAGKRTLSKP